MRDVIEIETRRLKLRPIAMSDAPRIARFCGDPGVGRNLAMTPLPYLENAAEGWIMIVRARENAAVRRNFVFAVDLDGEGLIGVLGAHGKSDDAYEFGYWFGRPYWGQGFATEAVGAFVAQARQLGALNAGHFVDNPASGRVLSKTGFAYTGETENMFSLARGERVLCKRMSFAGAADRGAGVRESALTH
ncbi:GNAT family N-acetyltransferase [Terricaulis sp.]|uniref:GNAT family N-acetyltransferase n=1 Tax=Terricaulis sp. TaxID=2768686 RepID=UPI003783AAE2